MMKWIMAGAILAWFPHWLASAAEDVDLPKLNTEVCAVFPGSNNEADESDVSRRWQVLTVSGDDVVDRADRGWLGISVGKVPASVAAHLESDERGVIILNVVRDSPAERAGLQVHDVILAIGDQEVADDGGRVAELIGAHQPGDAIEIKVLRAGQEQRINAELGTRPAADAFEWRVDPGPLAEVEDEIKTRGKFMLRDADGEWVIKDLGDLRDLKAFTQLPDNIRTLIPQSSSRSVQVYADNGEKRLNIRIERDGAVLAIDQEGDGEIVVRRTDQGGNETVATYANEEALRDADEEAYEAYKDTGKSVRIKVGIDGIDGLEDLDVDLDLNEWKDQFANWQAHLDEALAQANDARERAMDQLEEIMEQWKAQGWPQGGFPLDGWSFTLPGKELNVEKFPAPDFKWFGKPRHTFELREDGKIEVRIRKGDSELVQLYSGEDDLAARNPDLYGKYKELMSLEE